MARHHFIDPRVQAVIEALVRLTLSLGSVNAAADALSSAAVGDDGPVYPNRLHGLLAGDPTRSVNSATLESLEARLAALGPATFDAERIAAEQARIAATLASEAATAGSREEALARTAERLQLPLGLVLVVAGAVVAPAPHGDAAGIRRRAGPDWTWQTTAVDRALKALTRGPRFKAGLVVPTGGGKTRIALQVALRWLGQRRDRDDIVLWVTHRRHLRTQARRTLQKLAKDPALLEDGVGLFVERIRFLMVQDLPAVAAECAALTSLVIVDEAHHAAAPSYRPIFDAFDCPGLFLTATPNRSDARAIGIDEICYTITYRELFERGCLVEPVFEPPLDLPDLDWSTSEGVKDLADYLLDRADGDFTKTLVVVAQQRRAELLHEALVELLAERAAHVLTADNLGYVHGGGTSGRGSQGDFLDEFSAWPRGIVVATGQLVGEGFDDPTIDAVVVTYPSTSIGHLMQLAGRALRDHPGKHAAHIVQVRESPLAYHFEQRWLYQDISDALHPVLIDRTYGSGHELEEQVLGLLSAHRVSPPIVERIKRELAQIEPGGRVSLLLSGLPYFKDADTFEAEAQWGAILVTDANRAAFLEVFNDLSERTGDLKEVGGYLRPRVGWEAASGSAWKSHVDLIHAMEYARRELLGVDYAGRTSRPYVRPVGTTWLRYATFAYSPAVPPELEAFLADAANRTDVLTAYQQDPGRWALALKVELPLAGSLAFLLDAEQTGWFEDRRRALARALAEAEPAATSERLDSLCRDLDHSPVPLRLVGEFRQLLRPDRFERQSLRLKGG